MSTGALLKQALHQLGGAGAAVPVLEQEVHQLPPGGLRCAIEDGFRVYSSARMSKLIRRFPAVE